MAATCGRIIAETVQVTGGNRISISHLTYMHHVTEQLAANRQAEGSTIPFIRRGGLGGDYR